MREIVAALVAKYSFRAAFAGSEASRAADQRYPSGCSDSPVTRWPGSAIVRAMLGLIDAIIGAVIAAFRARTSLVAENLALRQQLAALRRRTPRPRLRPIDRAFRVILSRTWSRWADVHGAVFDARVRNLGIRQLRIAPKSPWQNGYAERFVGTLRRELLDHVIVLSERHLLHLVASTSPTTTRIART